MRLISKNPLEKEERDLILLQGEDPRRDERLRQGADHVGAPTVKMAHVSFAIAYYDEMPTAKIVIDKIIGEAEEIIKNEFPFTIR